MTDRTIDLARALENPDLGLITDYLANELPSEQVEEVRQRLQEDPAFRDYCAPIIAAWRACRPIPAMSEDELRASWDRFRQRAGILPAPARRRRPWWVRTLALVLLLGAASLAALAARRPVAEAWRERVNFVVVADSGRVMRLADGTRVRLGPGARLRVHRDLGTGASREVKLEGTASFEVRPAEDSQPTGDFIVWTRGAAVTSRNADFQVDAVADTTVLSVGKAGATVLDRVKDNVGQVAHISARLTDHTLGAMIGDRMLAVRGIGVLPLVQGKVENYPAPAAGGVPIARPVGQPTYTSVRIRPGAAPETLAVSRGAPPASPFAPPGVETIDPAAFARQPGVTTLGEGIMTLPDSGGRVTPHEIPAPEPMKVVRLEGRATFVVVPDGPPGAGQGRSLIVMTRGGLISTGGGVMRVETRGDTTECELLALAPGADSLRPPATQFVVLAPPTSELAKVGSQLLLPGMRARIVRGEKPEKLPSTPRP